MEQILEYEEFRYETDNDNLLKQISLLESSISEESNFDLAQEERDMVAKFLVLFAENNVTLEDIKNYIDNPTNESIVGNILGGLTGFALGKSVGKAFAKVLGVQKGILYDLFTSRLVGAAMGSALGGRVF